jgi:hypothetical protein
MYISATCRFLFVCTYLCTYVNKYLRKYFCTYLCMFVFVLYITSLFAYLPHVHFVCTYGCAYMFVCVCAYSYVGMSFLP